MPPDATQPPPSHHACDRDSVILDQRFSVAYRYRVAFTRDCFNPQNAVLAALIAATQGENRPKAAIFVDDGLAAARPGLVDEITTYFTARTDLPVLVAPPVLLPGGEAVKNDPTLIDRMHDVILDRGIDRHSYVIAVGGGAVIDAVGYAAATAHRGVRLVRVPTTVLGQNDSGIGVKGAINRNGAKNQIGTFAPPWAVVNDLDFLQTLPTRDRIAGLAEAVKVALIRDQDFFAWMDANSAALAAFETEATAHMIQQCARLHLRQITEGGDPFEQGSARPLDFGHWAAHKLETLTHHALRHGEAVAIGIALDTCYSVKAGYLAPDCETRVLSLLQRLGFSLFHPMLEAREASGQSSILAGLEEFREHLGGALTITLLAELGHGVEVHTMDGDMILACIADLARFRTP